MKLKRNKLSIIGVAISCLLLAGCTNQINSDRLEARQASETGQAVGTSETATSETAESLEDQGNELDDYEIDTYSLERQAVVDDEATSDNQNTDLYILDFIPVNIVNSNEIENNNQFKTQLDSLIESNEDDYLTDTLNINIQDILNIPGTVLMGQTSSLREYHGTIEIDPGLFLKPAYDLNKNIITYNESNIYNIVDKVGNYYDTNKTILKYIITDGETYVLARDTALEQDVKVYRLQAIQTGYTSQIISDIGSYISQQDMSNSELETAALDNSASYQMVKFIYDNSESIETDDKTLQNIDDFDISQIDIEAQGLNKRVQLGETYLIKTRAAYKMPMTVQIGVYNSDKQEVHLYKSEQSYESTNQVTGYNVYSILQDTIEQESITGEFQVDPDEQSELDKLNQNIALNNGQ